jgi:hypothetical protein
MPNEFWTHFWDVVSWLGNVSTIIVIIASLVTAYLCIRGFVPVLIRLGNGLWKRKIAIFANSDASFSSLKDLIKDSKLFNHTNIFRISGVHDLGIAEKASVLLVYWPEWKDDIDKVLNKKKDGTAMVVYAPPSLGPVPPTQMALLETHRNVVLSNFRGRLLNDLVVSMITTGYEKK